MPDNIVVRVEEHFSVVAPSACDKVTVVVVVLPSARRCNVWAGVRVLGIFCMAVIAFVSVNTCVPECCVLIGQYF